MPRRNKAVLALVLLWSCNASAQELGSATVSWRAPTQNEDGTPLTDLAGFKVYYGDSAGGPYITVITVPNPNTTTYIVENLAPGDYFFASTAYNTAGIESKFSNEAMKSVSGTPPPPTGPPKVVNGEVFTIVKQQNRFVLLPVGTVPMGTECDPDESVNGRLVVPRASVQWFGNVRPLVVVAECL